MADLTEAVAREMAREAWMGVADDARLARMVEHGWPAFVRLAEVGIHGTLAALREPSEAVVSAVTDVEFDYPVADHNSTISLYSREQVAAILTAAAGALAREHGLEPPGGQDRASAVKDPRCLPEPGSATSGAVRGAVGPSGGDSP